MPQPVLPQLIQALRSLPGFGTRSAERLAYHLLQTKERSHHLATLLQKALETIRQCKHCQTYTETALCQRCEDPSRDSSLLCIIETPLDLLAIEQSGAYNGQYYVLMGKISPLDGIGPVELGLHHLTDRVQQHAVHEVIFALSPTVEGQTTIHYIQSLLAPLNIHLSQLAHGIPMGGDLALLDGFTISSALLHRAPLSPA